MTIYVALLRAVNVGGTGKLAMADLQALCRDAGFGDVETYIASGNVVFESKASAKSVAAALERRLAAHAGKPVGVLVRTAAEMKQVLAGNPFPEAQPKFTQVLFLDAPLPADAIAAATGRRDEELAAGRREIYIHYPGGQGKSTLRLPAAAAGTSRNMNTVAKLVELVEARTERG